MAVSDIVKDISDKIPAMSKSHKLIAFYINEHADTAAYLTATRLGDTVGVSESTVVRFAIEMGYKGYPEMQKALKNHVAKNMNSLQRFNATDTMISGGDLVSKVMNFDIEKIKTTLDELDRENFEKAVSIIINAKKVYVIGTRSAAMLTGFFAYYLNIMLNNVVLLDKTTSSEMFERLMWISEGDAFVGISFPRYSTRTKNAMDFARKKGAKILAITDSETSPISALSDCALYAKSDMVSFVDSLVAPLSIINALIVAVSMNKKNELSEHLSELEEIWDKYDVYEKTN